MKKKITVLVIAVLTVLVCISALAACNKKPEEVILPEQEIAITDAKGLDNIRNYTGKRYKNYKFVLQKDIDLSDYERWAPIGTNVEDSFQGTLNGNNHKITGLTVKGWDENGNPLLVERGAQIDGVTAYYCVGLFGYTQAATITDLSLDVDIYYYMDIGYGFAAGLVGYNTGASKIENVNVGGSIRASNIYSVKNNYNDAGEYTGNSTDCTTTAYVGGVVAYSVGNTEIKNVKSTVDIDNSNYYAYYADENSVAPEVSEDAGFTPGYVVSTMSSVKYMPRQAFAGGIVSFMRGGLENDGITATVNGSSYTGNIQIEAKSSTTAGIVAAAYSVKIDDCNVKSANVSAQARYKNVSGGIAAMVDGGVIDGNVSSNVAMNLGKLDLVEAVNAGGIFGYACNLAVVKNSEVTDFKMTTNYDKPTVGGIGGVIRDSSVTDCSSTKANLYMTAAGINDQSLDVFAVTVSAIYGNSVLKDCEGSATNYKGREPLENVKGYSTKVDTTYVEDNGKPVARLYRKGWTTEYLTVFAEVKNGKLEVTLMDEELTELSKATYALTAPESNLFNPAETYLDVYFGADGFKTAESGALKADGRDLKNYEWRSGRAVIENIEVKSIED